MSDSLSSFSPVSMSSSSSGSLSPTTTTVANMLLKDTPDKYVMFPIQDAEIWAMYKTQVASFWLPDEVDLTKGDVKDWNEVLTEDERFFMSMVLAFFAGSDGIILENLAVRFMSDVKLAEARAFYGFQIAMENIHSEMYSILIDTFITDPETKHNLFHAMSMYPCVAKKANWAKKWIEFDNHCELTSFATRLVAFACVEGIFFSSSFASIFWLKKRGLMPGLTFSNQMIAKDESLHTDFAVLLYNKLSAPLSEKTVHDIIKDAVAIETEFIVDAVPCRMIGMNAQLMTRYIEFVADRLVVQLGYNRIYESANPFDFVEGMISLESKTNFFEQRVSEYSLSNLTKEDDIFELNGDF